MKKTVLFFLLFLLLSGCSANELLSGLFLKNTEELSVNDSYNNLYSEKDLNSNEAENSDKNENLYEEKKLAIEQCKNSSTLELQQECVNEVFKEMKCVDIRKIFPSAVEVDWVSASCYMSKKEYWDCREIYTNDEELKKMCYLHNARINKDESFCYDIKDIEFQVTCLGSIAAERDNFHLCGLLENTRQRYNCVIIGAIARKNYDDCSAISTLVNMDILQSVYNDPITLCRQKVEAAINGADKVGGNK